MRPYSIIFLCLMQIFILGMHRSGTSISARLINMMGAYFAPEEAALPASPGNPRGHWERRDVMQINDALLEAQGCRWNNLAGFSFSNAYHPPENLRQSMRDVLAEMDAHQPWFIKDPRLCLTLPAWLPLLEKPVAVLVYREPAEIVRSLFMRSSVPAEAALALWEYHAVGALNASRHMPRLFLRHAELLQNPYAACETLYRQLTALGVQRLTLPPRGEIEAFIDPSLYRAKADAITLTAAQQRLADMMQGSTPQTDTLHVSRESEILRWDGL